MDGLWKDASIELLFGQLFINIIVRQNGPAWNADFK
jgi:hypothetical protein